MKIEGKVAVVSGGASGLGESAVRRLINDGAKVVIADIQEQNGAKLVNEFGSSKAIFVKTDVSDPESVENVFQQAVKTFNRVDIVLNCAGILHAATILSRKCGPNEFKRTFNINVFGTFMMTKVAAKTMVKQSKDEETGEKGVIINVSSVASYEGQKGQTIYSATKGAINGMTMPLARDLGDHDIRIVTIAPGVFITPMASGWSQDTVDAFARFSPGGKLGKPE